MIWNKDTNMIINKSSLELISCPSMVLYEFKVAVMGSGGVGKSSLSIRFINNSFIKRYEPTIEETYTKVVSINDDADQVRLEIMDTAGNYLLQQQAKNRTSSHTEKCYDYKCEDNR